MTLNTNTNPLPERPMNTQTPTGNKAAMTLWAVAAAALLIALATIGGRLLRTDLIRVEQSPITLSTHQNTYTAYKGAVMPVILKVDGVDPQHPLLGMKLTLVDIPSYITLEPNGAEGIGTSDIGRIIVNKVNEAYIIVAYDMNVTQPGELIRLNFKVGPNELPRTSSKVRIFNEAGTNTVLVSEIATKTASGSYISQTINSGTAFTIVPTDGTPPPATATPGTNSNANGGATASPTYIPVPPGKDSTEGPAYNPTGAGTNRLIVQNVKALSSDYSSVVAIQWAPVVTVKPVTYEVYRARYKACGGSQDNCYVPNDFRKVAVVANTSYAIDNTALPGQQYTYAVSNTIDGQRSLLSNPSAPVIAGNDLGIFQEAGKFCLPHGARDGIRFGKGTWTSSDTGLVTVGSGSTIRPATTANAKGGIVFVTSTEGSQTLTNVVYVAPRGDTDCGGRVNAEDQNNVAVGWD